MGDYADDAINTWVRGGMQGMPRRKSVPKITCEECGKEVYGRAGLMQHINAKHEPKKYTWPEICAVENEERY